MTNDMCDLCSLPFFAGFSKAWSFSCAQVTAMQQEAPTWGWVASEGTGIIAQHSPHLGQHRHLEWSKHANKRRKEAWHLMHTNEALPERVMHIC